MTDKVKIESKTPYVRPSLTVYGSMVTLTAAGSQCVTEGFNDQAMGNMC